jgi:hypothetical protein
MHVVKVVNRDADLMEIIRAATTPRRFAGGLNRRQQERDEHSNDGNYHQQFNQRKAGASATNARRAHTSTSSRECRSGLGTDPRDEPAAEYTRQAAESQAKTCMTIAAQSSRK